MLEPMFGGIVNRRELLPEALTKVSSAGGLLGSSLGKTPVSFPHVPEMSEAASNPMQRTTPGAAQRVAKSPPLGGAVIVTAAEADFVTSACEVAVTVDCPEACGALNNPDVLTDPGPALTFQPTAVFVDPVMLAVNCCVPPLWTTADVGVTLTEKAWGSGVPEALCL